MKLAKKTRKRFHEAAGEAVEFSWPSTAPEPFRGHKYPIYTKSGRAFSIRLESVKRRPSGTKVIAVIDNDSHRPMIGLQGVRTEKGDYESEPERVHAVYEDEFAREAWQRNVLPIAEHRQRQETEKVEAKAGRGIQAELAAERQRKRLEA